MESDEFQAKTASFFAWLGRIGVHHSPKVALVDLRSAGRGRGLVAQSDIGEDEVLFTIPRDAVLNTTTALGSADNPAILEMPCWLALTAIILTEGQQEDSKWAPYLALLPSRLDSLVFWSESELLELQASTVVNKIGRASAEQLFLEHISPLGLSNTNTEMCHKVASVVMAYAFDIPEKKGHDDPESPEDGDDLVSDNEEEENTILSMIPLADMLNADADGNNARLCCDNEELEMRSIKPISKGEEILNDYGQLPRSDLLRRYGYISDKYAAYDVAELSTQSLLASLSTEQPLLAGGTLQPLSREKLEQRVELAQREGVYEDSYDLTHPGPDDPSIPDELLALLYILLLDNENLAAIETSHASLPSRSKLATSLVGQILTKILESRKQEYATTIEADQAILQADNLPSRKRMAVEVRLGEKLVLEKAIQEAQSLTGDNKRMRFKQETPTNSAFKHTKGKRKPEEDGSGRKKIRLR
ncbi:putative SET domain-containing protein [Drepanopeziza brunnea f. sp. 'multigermtubi' MB_m1]|uniref:Putative SET domain-containing protein n=1 Tax=Marssonina brunnea f. sp. multigermtubi (strain MB_m1) TaxID=1072389 RepID=K1WL04_MARBU|nr:putative SET domain-containing protein [Drepanopeziza brunnea f. sp. 'multigermtubi' MB_m1]EKD13526.1 putative SET domain-containing protein [Drepanopeziza brunnea f. sp. 'multigermtubi' MB_m1]